MERPMHYTTVSEAVNELRKQGFTVDFNLEENCIACHAGRFDPESFEIVDIYRYEGDSDPADEAAVYAIASASGVKGILVTGYGVSGDTVSTRMLEKLGAGRA